MVKDDTPLLECRGVSKAFGAVQALYNVDFDVSSGEVMALVGDNGAGKSTLIKSVAGIYALDEGELLFEGEHIEIHSPREAARLGIEIVYQDLALADNLAVVANMFLGRERVQNGFVLNESSMERTSRETLDSLHVTTLRSVRQAVAGTAGGARPPAAPRAAETMSEYLRGWLQRVRDGELGTLPIIVGLVLIVVTFAILEDNFFTERNFTNLLLQMSAVATIAIGVVFVLLIGEIDLSVAFVSAVGGVVMT